MNREKIKLLIDSIETNIALLKLELNDSKSENLVKNENEESNIIKLTLNDLLKNDNYIQDQDIEYEEDI